MNREEIVIVADLAEESVFTLMEVCQICHVTPQLIQDFINHDIIQLDSYRADHQFTVDHLSRIQQSLRLQKELEVNLTGVAIILDLLDDRQKMQAEINLLKSLQLMCC